MSSPIALSVNPAGDTLQTAAGSQCVLAASYPTTDYVSLLSQEHAQRPNLVAWVQTLVGAMQQNQTILASLPAAFDVATAVGQQLDYVGQWVGASRYVDVAVNGVFFAFDTPNVGFDQGYWYLPNSPTTSRVALTDDDYRMLLAAKILDNQWDGSIPDAYRVWNGLSLMGQSYQLFIQDLGGMKAIIGLVNPSAGVSVTQRTLLTSGVLGVRPVGVQATYAYTPTPGAMFAFDLNTTAFAGFDLGSWAQTS